MMGPTPPPPPPDGMVPEVAMWIVAGLFLAGMVIAIALALHQVVGTWRRTRRARRFVVATAEHWDVRCN